MSKLFEEAIADAKKLKEVAEENAKKAILESVTPQIREFIEEQLLEQDDSEELESAMKAELKSAIERVGGGNDVESFQKALKSADFSKVISQNIRGTGPIVGFEDPKVQKAFINTVSDEHLKSMGVSTGVSQKVGNAVKKGGGSDPGKGLDALGAVLGDTNILQTLTSTPGAATKRKNEVSYLDEEVYLDEAALASLVELIGEDNLDSLNESKSQEALFSAVKGAVATMDDDQREQLLNLSHKLNESANHLSKTEKGEDMSKKYYEVDLRALREALEEEAHGDHSNEMMATDEVYHEEGEEHGKPMDEELASLYEEFSALLEQDEEPEADVEAPEAEEAPAAEGGDDMLAKDEVEDAIRALLDDLALDLEGEGAGAGGGAIDEPAGDEAPEFDLAAAMGGGDDEEALNEVFEVDPRVLRQELGRIRRMVAEGKVDHHFGGKGGGNAGVDGSYGGKGKQNAGVSGAFGGGKEGQDAFTNPPHINKLNEAIRQLRRQNRAQHEKLNKYRGAVNSLREQLEDLNLFNAKLLYVNKLLQNKGLNESQKKSVIKALDEAQSLTEAKSLYKSLTETFSRGGRSTISESRVLGSSSRPTTSSQSSATSSNSELSRWQRLAGL